MLNFLSDILKIESTTGTEKDIALFIAEKYTPKGMTCDIQDTPDGRVNLFFKLGEPKIVFNSHTDTVPPYIPPTFTDEIIYGRGSCDAKGQLAYLWQATNELIAEGEKDFGLLMTFGEETGSVGAKQANNLLTNTKYIIVGEPTENKLILASKGTNLIKVTIRGKNCHSGYPQFGDNAINRMRKFLDRLDNIGFPVDDVMGETTYNIGWLRSDNAQNVVPDLVTFNLFIRTTFASHDTYKEKLEIIKDENTELEYPFNKGPLKFLGLEGFETGIVAYGTDAPSFTNVPNKLLYGPGTILVAHTADEQIKIKDMYRAVEDVKKIFRKLKEKNV
ncbi:MAG: M20/M25/M40 family metallo-hydrolase [Bacteroidetes bacterium]|nr:M20/M25/M40 family metallo-hydrolase [Bacteroidota bacterium]